MPSDHYMEVAHMLLAVAGNDIDRADEIRTAVKVLVMLLRTVIN